MVVGKLVDWSFSAVYTRLCLTFYCYVAGPWKKKRALLGGRLWFGSSIDWLGDVPSLYVILFAPTIDNSVVI